MNNELMIFNNEKFGEVRMVKINGKPYAVGSDVYKKPNNAINTHCRSTLKQGIATKQGNISEMILIPQGDIIRLVASCKLDGAEEFESWIFDEVIPKVLETGKFDIIEDKINKIEDEKERQMSLSLYTYEQALKINPNDMLSAINYSQTKLQLETYKQQKQLDEIKNDVGKIKDTIKSVEEDTKIIKEQQTYICNRTNFNERIKILANKYFGRDMQEAYHQLFDKMRLLGSFDVYVHRKHEWEKINADRAKVGKKPYKSSTLKSKVNYIDVIDTFGKWELASEAYKTIETEFIK
jgi:prophage antirepressor-like protein